jgi:HK97 family phage portal protein
MLDRRYRRFVSYWVTVHLKPAAPGVAGVSISGAVRETTRGWIRLHPARYLLARGSTLADGGAVIPVENIDWIQPHDGEPAAFMQARAANQPSSCRSAARCVRPRHRDRRPELRHARRPVDQRQHLAGVFPAVGGRHGEPDRPVQTYAAIYQSQPNVRKCVDLISRDVSNVPIRLGDEDDTENFTPRFDHPAWRTLRKPNPWTTRQRFFGAIMGDLGTYDNSYALKVRTDPISLVRVPPQYVQPMGGLWPSGYRITFPTGKVVDVPASELIHYRGFYNPVSTITGLSPIETLRRMLAEEDSAAGYRAGLWAQGARMAGVIERPDGAPPWGEETREKFRAQFESMFSGEMGSGRTAILEEGMQWKPMQFNAVEAQYVESRQLNLEECVRAYHIPLSQAQIKAASKSNIDDEHTQYYQDTLGPWFELIASETVLQFINVEWPADDRLALRFNIDIKLRGSFATEAAAMSTAVGAPWQTRNEGRARRGLPPIEGRRRAGRAAERARRRPAVAQDDARAAGQSARRRRATDPGAEAARLGHEGRRRLPAPGRPRVPADPPAARPEVRAGHGRLLRAAAEGDRQHARLDEAPQARRARRDPVGAARAAMDERAQRRPVPPERRDRDHVRRARRATAGSDFDEARMYAWLRKNADLSAAAINQKTSDEIGAALADPTLGPDDTASAIRHTFDVAVTARAAQIGRTKVGTAANFGAHEAARQSGYTQKTWTVNSEKPRDSHAELDGESVALDDTFSNGMQYPCDPSGGADEVAGCTCSLSYSA